MDLQKIMANKDWDDFLILRDEIKQFIRKNEDSLELLEEKELFKFLFLFFTPQSYWTKIEKRIIRDFNLEKVPASLDRWDFKTKDEKYGEVKTSYLDSEWKFHFVQIRPYQNNDYYLLVAILPKENFRPMYFIIKKEELEKFLNDVNANNCHWVLKNMDDEGHIEYRFSIPYDSEIFTNILLPFQKTKEEVNKILNA